MTIFSNRDLTKVKFFFRFLPVTSCQGWILYGGSADKQTLDEGCGNFFLPLVSIRRASWLAGLFFGSLWRLNGGMVVSYIEPNNVLYATLKLHKYIYIAYTITFLHTHFLLFSLLVIANSHAIHGRFLKKISFFSLYMFLYFFSLGLQVYV